MIFYAKILIMANDFNIKKIAESGQCFRIDPIDENTFLAIASNRYCKISSSGKIITEEGMSDGFWNDYFDMSTDYKRIRESIDPDDSFLTEAVKYGEGIRILRQDPWEMIITFIISQRKNIPAIKSCVNMLSRKYGKIIGSENGIDIYSFPTPSELAKSTLEELKACSLGYRDEYVLKASRMVDNGEIDLSYLSGLSDSELYENLLAIRGVGPKVANCVLLFGFHRIAAFPVDVWIKRVIDEVYLGNFPIDRYKGYAGIIQQYMFYYGKNIL